MLNALPASRDGAVRADVPPIHTRIEAPLSVLPPQPLTPFVGRERELRFATDLLRQESVRLLTLTGPGGVGKTRLGLRLAHDLTNDFADGVVFVPLAAIVEPRLLLDSIARALGIRTAGTASALERLCATVGDRRVLLVLDNFEQIAVAAPDLAAALAACPALKVLVTSRVPLHLGGEQELAIPPLDVPDRTTVSLDELAANPAVALFAQRARSVKADFGLSSANAPAVAEACRRLDGLPLAIELAAARSKVLSPQALLARLAHGLDVLSGGPRDAPARLQTLRTAIAWSYDLLTAEEQRLFRRLAVFSGGFSLEAVEWVMGNGDGDEGLVQEPDPSQAASSLSLSVLNGIASLVDSSLLQARDGDDGESRLSMLETVREFGLEQLRATGELEIYQRRHAEFFQYLAVRVEPAIYGGFDQTEWLNRIEREHDNFRAALRWAEQSASSTLALQLAGALHQFWYIRGYLSEGLRWLRMALDLPIDQTSLSDRARALLGAGHMVHWLGDADAAGPLLEAGLEIARAIDDQLNIGMALGLLGVVAEDSGDYDRAVALDEESLAIYRPEVVPGALPSRRALITAHLGVATWGQGNLDRATLLWEEALAKHRAVSDTWGVANTLGYLALVACERNELARAAAFQRDSTKIFWDAGSVDDIAAGITTAAAIGGLRGDFSQAARFFGAGEALRDLIGSHPAYPERVLYERVLAAVRLGLGPHAFAAAHAAGHALTASQAVEEALAWLATVAEPQIAERGRPGLDLTPRERDVLQLLVKGQTDRDIAATLFISPRTAQGHVARLFDKLGVTTRTAAVAAALQADLLAD